MSARMTTCHSRMWLSIYCQCAGNVCQLNVISQHEVFLHGGSCQTLYLPRDRTAGVCTCRRLQRRRLLM